MKNSINKCSGAKGRQNSVSLRLAWSKLWVPEQQGLIVKPWSIQTNSKLKARSDIFLLHISIQSI